MELNREILNSFVDGELAPREMERVAELLANRPELDAYVKRQEHLRDQLRARFLELDSAMPKRLTDAVRIAPVSWRWRLRALLKRDFMIRRLAPGCAALALGLVIGVVIRPQGDLAADPGGQLIARGGLREVLDTRLAAEGRAPGPAQIGVSFRKR